MILMKKESYSSAGSWLKLYVLTDFVAKCKILTVTKEIYRKKRDYAIISIKVTIEMAAYLKFFFMKPLC